VTTPIQGLPRDVVDFEAWWGGKQMSQATRYPGDPIKQSAYNGFMAGRQPPSPAFAVVPNGGMFDVVDTRTNRLLLTSASEEFARGRAQQLELWVMSGRIQ